MNYANMIEEKDLKKAFIVATLISTIAGTFTTGINLYDRVADKRAQKRTDHAQDDKIKALEQRVDAAEGGGQPGGMGQGQGGGMGRDSALRRSLESGGPQIRREYDQDYARLGSRFAEGDLVAQTQLQGQIITLQGTVIKVLEEALMTGRPPDVTRLFNASEFAREGSIRALRDQYQRMLQAAPMQRPGGPVRRISSTPALRGNRAIEGPPPRDAIRPPPSGPLYCPYAEELQDTDRPLDPSFQNSGPCECPECGFVIPVEEGRSWKIDKQVAVRESRSRGGGRGRDDDDTSVSEDRTYRLTNRFLVKCHREGGGFACFLCYQFRNTDTLSKTLEGLVAHVSKRHDARDYDDEVDIRAKGK